MPEKKAAINWKHPNICVTRQCELLGLSKGALYYKPIPESAYNLKLMSLIDKQYLETPFYGSRKMAAHLRLNGHGVNRKRIQRLMEKMCLFAIFPGPNTSQRNHQHKVYPYLLKGLNICFPNQVWATDITFIRLSGGFAYLVAVIDWFSRFVLSWRLSNSLETTFCLEVFEEAIETFGCPDIVNTDQGCQFTSEVFTKLLKNHGISISMDGKGRCLDNIMIERLWRSVKYEEVYLKGYQDKSMVQANKGFKTYFNFYNNKRPHQSLQDCTPYQVHMGEVDLTH